MSNTDRKKDLLGPKCTLEAESTMQAGFIYNPYHAAANCQVLIEKLLG